MTLESRASNILPKTGLTEIMLGKKKHITLSLCGKLKGVRQVESGMRWCKIIEDFNIVLYCCNNIRHHEAQAQILKLCRYRTVSIGKVRKTVKKPQLPQLDDALYQWFIVKQVEGKAVSEHTTH